MRLDKLGVKNFGCLRDVEVDLSPFTVLVGPNDAGKSMLLRAIENLSRGSAAPDGWRTVYPTKERFVESTFDGKGGEQLLAANGLFGDVRCSYAATLGINLSVALSILSEKIEFERANEDETRLAITRDSSGGENLVTATIGGEKREVRYTGGTTHPVFQVAGRLSWPSEAKDPTEAERRATLMDHIKRMQPAPALRRFRLFPEQLRRSVPVDAMLPHSPEIHADGWGLPGAMANLLLSDREVADRIEAVLRAGMPNVRRVKVVTHDEMIPREETDEPDDPDAVFEARRFESKRVYDLALETRQGATVSSRYISDGVLLYMAYLLLTIGPSSQSILMLEEPETGVHPGLLAKLIERLRERSQFVQVILTTHSPLLLNLVSPEEIRVVARGADGGTQITPFTSTPELERLLEYQGPGEVWVNMGEDYLRRVKSSG